MGGDDLRESVGLAHDGTTKDEEEVGSADEVWETTDIKFLGKNGHAEDVRPQECRCMRLLWAVPRAPTRIEAIGATFYSQCNVPRSNVRYQ